MEGHLEDLACGAVRYASSLPGVAYCDARAETRSGTQVLVENGRIDHVRDVSDSGLGVRILDGGRVWRFVSVSSPESADEVKSAIDCAGLGARSGEGEEPHAGKEASAATTSCASIVLRDISPRTARITRRVAKSPDPDSIMSLGLECSKAISGMPHITNSVTAPQFETVSKYFTSSEGADILEEYTDTTVSMTATATADNVRSGGRITRTVDSTVGGRGGLEAVDGESHSRALYVASKASELAAAGTAKHMADADVVMNPNFVALLVHEILGHPSEADRVMGREMAWAGGAWWSGMTGGKVASESLNVFDDPTAPGSLGWYDYDDEGVKSSRTQLIKRGVLQGHMQSRETAAAYGAEPTGNMRAAGYGFMPVIRMACTCIEPGDHAVDEMIWDIRDGYAIYDMKIPSIDMNRYNWSISCQYARKITGGELAETVRDVVVSGTAPGLFRSVSACGKDFEVTPITNCGKGDPMQSLAMGNGGPSIRGKATVGSI
ncbi:MAG: TldD/PmbA family protein [Nitrosopumilaceae archaeon]|nr:TldD/PmbA family protein [Nitrosopumilaceae archaeon]